MSIHFSAGSALVKIWPALSTAYCNSSAVWLAHQNQHSCCRILANVRRLFTAAPQPCTAIDRELAALVKEVSEFSCTPASAIATSSAAAAARSQWSDMRIVEASNSVTYHSAAVQCTACVQLDTMREASEADWTLGLVQACHSAHIENRYGHSGSAHWLLRPLLTASSAAESSGRRPVCVNDSDGHHYPFYSKYSLVSVAKERRFTRSRVQLSLEDSFHPTITWRLDCSRDSLTEILRHQSFRVWLVAAPLSAKRLHAMHHDAGGGGGGGGGQLQSQFRILPGGGPVAWEFSLRLRFDPTLPVGSRLVSVERSVVVTPSVASSDTGGDSLAATAAPQLPPGAVSGGTCNNLQALVWRPNNVDQRQQQQLLVRPKEYRPGDWGSWLRDVGLVAEPVGKMPPPAAAA